MSRRPATLCETSSLSLPSRTCAPPPRRAIRPCHVHFLAVDVGKLRLDQVLLLVLHDVHRRHPLRRGQGLFLSVRLLDRKAVEQEGKTVLQVAHLFERIEPRCAEGIERSESIHDHSSSFGKAQFPETLLGGPSGTCAPGP